MNKSGGIAAEFLSKFPLALQGDERLKNMAAVIAMALEMRWQEAERGSIYPNIDRMPEELLDILAYDFKVDWWDADYGLEEKRRLLKSSWQVHRMLGTKAAVEKAASAVYPYATVEEWFEYGGEPYHFRLHVDLPQDVWTSERHKRLIRQMEYYKNLRSHMDSVTYQLPPVLLHNHQVLRFAAMRMLMGQENRNQPAMHRLLMAMRMRQHQAQSVRMRVSGRMVNRGAAALRKVLVQVRMHNAARLPELSTVSLSGMGIENRQSVAASVTTDTMWRLDGTYRLDGRKKLNAGIVRSEL